MKWSVKHFYGRLIHHQDVICPLGWELGDCVWGRRPAQEGGIFDRAQGARRPAENDEIFDMVKCGFTGDWCFTKLHGIQADI